MLELLGKVHSIESCGTVDGPGVRFVVFLQGCPMRCKYCHNPDTWALDAASEKMTVDEVLQKYDGVKAFCSGGITITGGEPLLQLDFVTELFRSAQARGIHTALDTSGVVFNLDNTEKIDELLKYTSLVLLDIKHINEDAHKQLTGWTNKNILEFAKYLSDNKKPMWVRHVVVPGITDDKEQLSKLGEFLGTLNNIVALDILPYHNMAVSKYDNMKMNYPLTDVPPLSKEEAINARNVILESMKSVRASL